MSAADDLRGSAFALRLRDFAAACARGLRASTITPFLAGHCACTPEATRACGRLAVAAGPLEALARDPREADLLIVAGAVNSRLAPLIERTWRQMPEPRRVLAWGNCAVSGGLCDEATSPVLQGIDRLLPVDVFVPGCPPDEASLARALRLLVAETEPRRRRPLGGEGAWRFGEPREPEA